MDSDSETLVNMRYSFLNRSMSTRSYFIPAVDAYESFLTVSYILFNPMFRTHPAICGTKYASTFVLCI